MAQPQEQQRLSQDPEPPSPTGGNQDVDLKKASAREDLAFLTSGAKEKLDKTLAGMRGAGHIMTHPFNKQAKEEATAKTIEEKNAIGDKQERIRATAHIQLLQEKAVAVGEDPRAVPGLLSPVSPSAEPQLQNGAASGGHTGAHPGHEDLGSAAREPVHDTEPETESEMAANEDEISETSSTDGSSRGRALNQIPPDSKDYQSG